MAGFGWAVAFRLNRLINKLIDSIYVMSGSTTKFVIYFLFISVVVTMVYICLLWLFEVAYHVKTGRLQFAAGIASYRSCRMVIPLLIGFVRTLFAIPIAIAAFLEAIIMGIVSLAKGMKTAFLAYLLPKAL